MDHYGVFGEEPIVGVNIPAIPTIIQKPIKGNDLNKLIPQIEKWINDIFEEKTDGSLLLSSFGVERPNT